VGKDQLTTTRVADRAGVSVGTLYQYFPNKSSLLQAVLRRHLLEVTEAVERVSLEQHGHTPHCMATALIHAFLHAKMSNASASAALYAVSSELDSASILREMQLRNDVAIVAMFRSAQPPLTADPTLVASVVQGALAGVSRRILDQGAIPAQIETHRQHLIHMLCAYLNHATA
jgi:AcrR family transcriptional regulator